MTFAAIVKGGTGAGRKRPKRDKPGAWNCLCADTLTDTAQLLRQHPGYLARCSDCGATRDGGR